ncbi:MAG: 2Fe-2S iron-sulfur cluster-binding protein [Longimicrobiales bacterium]|nr:2Fe-2S iron-sulfur cluster-binding protein [Longimicrobiales bacterium]
MTDQQRPKTVTLSIDGREVTVPTGTTILRAAESLGIKVPHYCYHPGLSSPAMCRLCLVEVEGWPKLAPACKTTVADGQVVHTNSELAQRQRTGVLEFYLVNHPLDCPICDQSGECQLQDYVFAEGRKHGRGREPKRVLGRDDFGGDVLFNGDRCVMCTRCVRFMREVAEDERLCVVERGNRAIIDTFFDDGLEGSPFAGNIVDICPVGALISKDFLHKARAWDLDRTPSVCASCSQGCNITLQTRDNLVQRLKPRENLDVNGWWMCDFGRANYEWINRADRLETPMVDGKSQGWAEALGSLIGRLTDAKGEVRAITSAHSSNEEMGLLKALLAEVGGVDVVYRSPRTEGEIPLPGFPLLARREDLAPNVSGAEIFGFTRVGDDDSRGGVEGLAGHTGVLIVVGDPLEGETEDFGAKAELFIYLGSYPSKAANNAHYVLPITTFAEQEGTYTNVHGRVQRFWPGLQSPGSARPAWLILGALLAELTDTETPATADQAFARVAEQLPEFGEITYRDMGTRGAPVKKSAGVAGD